LRVACKAYLRRSVLHGMRIVRVGLSSDECVIEDLGFHLGDGYITHRRGQPSFCVEISVIRTGHMGGIYVVANCVFFLSSLPPS